jgi:hypothetical protein
MGRKRSSEIACEIENARNTILKTSINLSEKMKKEIVNILRKYDKKIRYELNMPMTVDLYYNAAPLAFNTSCCHNGMNKEKLNKKILNSLERIEVTYTLGRKRNTYELPINDEGRRIASLLAQTYNLCNGKELTPSVK